MVISTELVSLNIHEALTFDGTEVCLHPDLFGSLPTGSRVSGAKSTHINHVGSNFSTSPSIVGGAIPVTNRTLSFDDRSSSTVYNTPSLMPSGSNLSGNSTAIATNSTTPHINVVSGGGGCLLKAGDLIEIRVWDPISVGGINSAGINKVSSINSSTIIRPRKMTTANAIVSSSTHQVSMSDPKNMLNQRYVQLNRDGENSQDEEKFNVRARAESEVTTNSLQYSIKSDANDDLAIALMTPNIYSTSSKDSTGFTSQSNDNLSLSSESAPSRQESNGIPTPSTLPPPRSLETTLQTIDIPTTKNATHVLPPVFPRGRTNTGDNNTFANVVTNRLVSKRPMPVQRRSTGGAVPFDPIHSADTKTISVTAPISAISTLASQHSRHHRDISDMTTESLAGVAISTSPPLDMSINSSHIRSVHAHDAKAYTLPNTNAVISQVDDEDENITHLCNTHTLRLSFVVLVTEKSLSSLKGTARTQISILRQVADLYQLSNYDMVTINKVESFEEEEVLNAVSAHFLLVTIKNQFISRGDMHYFQSCLNGSWVYEGQRLYESSRGFQAIARGVRHSDKQVKSGIVTEKTTVTFRSRSARIFWLVQMSSEMWEYSSPYGFVKGEEGVCEIYFDKWIAFIYELFAKWKEVEATHSLTVIFFSRTFLGSAATTNSVSLKKDIYGRLYEDHFRPVVENFMGPDWDSVVRTIKEAFVSYPYDVAWNLHTDETFRRPSSSSQGNVLEAINVTLNLLQFHYLDRDLHRTGNSLVLVSAGNGVFEVDRGLAGVSYQRMMDNGIGSDMLSLGLPALHVAPFFMYSNVYQVGEAEAVDEQEQYFEVPHWMHLSFTNYESDKTVFSKDVIEKVNTVDTSSNDNLDGFEIRANGFVLPRVFDDQIRYEPSSPLLRPSSVPRGSSSRNSFAEKTVAYSTQRQLIEGRDFRDILEACRPRHAGTIPTPLRALLEICATKIGNQPKLVFRLCEQDEVVDTVREEWGACHFNEHSDSLSFVNKRTNPVSQRNAPIANSTSLNYVGDRPVCTDVLLSSSATSYHTGHLDLEVQNRGNVGGGLQLQMPAFLDYHLLEGGSSEPNTSSNGDYSSDDDINVSTFEDRFRQMMEAHDRAIPSLSTPKDSNTDVADTASDNPQGIVKQRIPTDLPQPIFKHGKLLQLQPPGSLGAVRIQQKQQQPIFRQGVLQKMQPQGSLGAALIQHKQSSGTRGLAVNANTNSTPKIVNGRPSSVAFRRTNEKETRGLSPLLLPPVISQQQLDDSTGQEYLTSSHRSTAMIGPRNAKRNKNYQNPRSSEALNLRDYRNQESSVSSNRSEHSEQDLSRQGMLGIDTPRRNRGKMRKKVFNPFRQEDEEEVLEKKSHNRRRWSHVFPVGEIEFKRHAGPNWRSLSAPAILPLAIDYFPPKEEIDQRFTFSYYNVTLSEFEKKNYTSNKDLLMEMVRQRITQDFQLVSEDNINASNYRPVILRDRFSRRPDGKDIESANGQPIFRQFLSMGHRLQVLAYDAASDIIEVTRYTLKNTEQKRSANTFKYQYQTYCQETQDFCTVVQTFDKYTDQYNWNKFDRIICGAEDKELREGMRFRRLMFGIIPPKCKDAAAEQDYIAKFRRLLEYLNKLREKDESHKPLAVKFVGKYDELKNTNGNDLVSTPGIEHNAMQRFYVQLRKGVRDAMEWIEIVIDSTFNTTWSYRIIFNWLVASSGKVDAQVQMLQRRCVQHGLNLIPFPSVTVSRTLMLNPFKAPSIFCVRDKEKATTIDASMISIDFIYDGVFYTDVKSILECIKGGTEYKFSPLGVAGRQFVHRTGTIFARVFTDKNGMSLIVVIGNYLYLQSSKDDKVAAAHRIAFEELFESIQNLC